MNDDGDWSLTTDTLTRGDYEYDGWQLDGWLLDGWLLDGWLLEMITWWVIAWDDCLMDDCAMDDCLMDDGLIDDCLWWMISWWMTAWWWTRRRWLWAVLMSLFINKQVKWAGMETPRKYGNRVSFCPSITDLIFLPTFPFSWWDSWYYWRDNLALFINMKNVHEVAAE